MTDKLTFGFGNAKLSKNIAHFSLPAGYSCPFAKECLTKANRITGKLIEGKHCRFRCFSASQENSYPSVRISRWKNFDILRKSNDVESIGEIIQRSLPHGINMVRVHVSGDFYNEAYFLAWLNIAMNHPWVIFYGYTKAIPFLVKYKKHIPNNFKFVASRGGTHDNLIRKYRLKSVEVVYSPEEAEQKGLEIDHDDSLAYQGKDSFAILIHGTQPPGSDASKAWTALRNRGIGGYGDSVISRNNNRVTPTLRTYITIKNNQIYFPPKVKVEKPVSFTLPEFALIENGEFVIA
jgi:hypothetical protein